jgi:hypothetical protein
MADNAADSSLCSAVHSEANKRSDESGLSDLT